MNANQSARFIGFKRVASFGEVNAADLLPIPPSKKPTKAQQLFIELGTTRDIESASAPASVIGMIGRANLDQLAGEGGFHGSTTTKDGIRKKLKALLLAMRKTAAAIAKTQGLPEIMADFVLPKGTTDAQLAAHARAFAEAAKPFIAKFIELEHRPDFIELLLADVTAFENAGKDQDASIQTRAGASATIRFQIKRGRLIIEQLDAIMLNRFEDNPEMLAAWHAASRVEHPVRGRKKAAPPTVVEPGVVIPLAPAVVA